MIGIFGCFAKFPALEQVMQPQASEAQPSCNPPAAKAMGGKSRVLTWGLSCTDIKNSRGNGWDQRIGPCQGNRFVVKTVIRKFVDQGTRLLHTVPPMNNIINPATLQGACAHLKVVSQ